MGREEKREVDSTAALELSYRGAPNKVPGISCAMLGGASVAHDHDELDL